MTPPPDENAETRKSPSRQWERSPRSLTSFVGRGEERRVLIDLLTRSDVRLVTITGAGGVGKTRLSLKIAEEMEPQFADGVAFAGLEAYSSAERVPAAIIRSLGVQGEDDLFGTRVRDVLSDARVLLVVDNFEQVIESAPVVSDLLREFDQLKILVTSRLPLRISGEHVYQLLPLSLPSDRTEASLDVLDQSEAVRLFVARALAVNTELSLEPDSLAAIIEICRRLEGFPLAIELAAAKSRQFELPDLLELLGNRLVFLDQGARDQPLRMQSLHGAISWSYSLLTPEEQKFFRALSVFPAGFTIESAEALNGSLGLSKGTPESLTSLVDNSLIWKMPGSSGRTRFRMYDSVRDFGNQALIDNGEFDSVRLSMADYFSHVAMASEIAWTGSDDTARVVDAIEEEEPNFQAALEAIRTPDRAEQFCRLVADLTWFWYYRGHIREGRQWLEAANELMDQTVDQGVRAWIGVSEGLLAQVEEQNVVAERCFREASELAASVGDERTQTLALEFHAAILLKLGDLEKAKLALDELRPKIDLFMSPSWHGHHRFHLGLIAFQSGQIPEAIGLFVESAEAYDHNGVSIDGIDPLSYLVLAEIDAGNFEAAREALDDIANRLSIRKSELDFALLFAGLSAYLVATNQPSLAVRFSASAISFRERLGVPLPMPANDHYRAAYQKAQQALTPEQFAEASRMGANASLGDLLDLVHSVISSETTSPLGDDKPLAVQVLLGVTDREMDVLHLLARGLSNVQIGEVLFITSGTVRTHVSNLLGKLDANSRTQAVAIAREKGLIWQDQPKSTT